jgi:DNA polymerase I-like protein with 3'-5' exonuclease and polymerase domains
MFPPNSSWKAPDVSRLPRWDQEKNISIDTEFYDPDLTEKGLGARRGVKMAGYSFAFENGMRFYVPVRHPEGNVENPAQGIQYLKDQARGYKGTLVGANISTELDILECGDDIIFPNIKGLKDVLIAAPLINELHRSYSLQNVAKREGFQGKDEDLLKQAAQCYGADIRKTKGKNAWKGMIAKLPAKYVGPYGEEDAWLPMQLLPILESQLREQDLMGCWAVEMQLLPILLKLRQRGVRLDFDKLDQVERWARAQELEYLAKIFDRTGINLGSGNCMKTDACVPIFAAVGIQVPQNRDEKTNKLKYSLTSPWLDSIDHEIASDFKYVREMYKLYGTFTYQLRNLSTNGRIHTTFNQIVGAKEGSEDDEKEKSGARFGRLSSRDPNMQQMPSRAKYAAFFRECFIPEEGAIWGTMDYSQNEPRWTTHFANLLKCSGASEAARAYCDDPYIDNHDYMSALTGLHRKIAKELFLALCYGEGGKKMCEHHLHLPTRWALRYKETNEVDYFEYHWQAKKARQEYVGEASYYETAGSEGQKILDQFNEKAPYIRELKYLVEKAVRDHGVLRIKVGGRVIHFPIDNNGKYDWAYKGLNRLIQGTAGMQMKLALIKIHTEIPEAFIQLQVHDDVSGSFESVSQMKKVANAMSDVVKASVPMAVDTEYGPNYGRLTEICRERDCTSDKTDKIFCDHHAAQFKRAA